jgi:hypothetical protein
MNIFLINVKERLINSEKYTILFIFSIASLVRTVPELIAYPYPLGYDVINYYIPVVTNFDKYWSIISGQFPFYVSLLHVINNSIGSSLSPHFVVTTFAILTYGIFGVSIFFIGRKILKINMTYSMYLTFFVIFQLTVLRTTWDLHRDLFSLSTMLLLFSIIYERKDINNRIVIIIASLTLAVITAMSDRMVGLLCVLSLIIYTITDPKNRLTILCSLVCTFFFIFSLIQGYDNLHNNTIELIKSSQTIASTSYNPTHLLILFLVYNGMITPLGIIGFKFWKNKLLKIPLLITGIGAFSWIFFQGLELLVADRWIILFGIFLSIFAGYGIIQLSAKKTTNVTKIMARSFLYISIAMGIIYAAMPYDESFVLYGIAGKYIQGFAPLTMQFNALDIYDNDNLIDLVSWINNNTDPDSLIIGEKHWRGWMEIKLQDERDYIFSDDIYALYKNLVSEHTTNFYMIINNGIKLPPETLKDIKIVYSDQIFNLFKINK